MGLVVLTGEDAEAISKEFDKLTGRVAKLEETLEQLIAELKEETKKKK